MVRWCMIAHHMRFSWPNLCVLLVAKSGFVANPLSAGPPGPPGSGQGEGDDGEGEPAAKGPPQTVPRW